jgi:branched-chain amino acid transport system substrate-binding protein
MEGDFDMKAYFSRRDFLKASGFAAAAAALAGCSSSAGSAGSSASGKTLKIGVFEPASGDNGAGGKQEVLGIQYANSVSPTVDVNGETYTVELVVVDNQSSTDKAVSAASELVSKGVSVVLGSYGSGVCIAAAPTFAAAEIPAIGCSCTNPAVTQANPYYFRVCFLDPFQGSVMANFAKDEFSAAGAYALSMQGEDYGSGLATYFKDAFEKLGGTVTYEQFPEGTSDFAAYVQNAKNAGADVIFAPSATTYAAQIIKQAASAGYDKPILAGDTWESSVILDAQKGTGLEVYCSTFFDENDDSGEAKTFVEGFKAWLDADSQNKTNNGGNDIVAAVSALGYDAYMVALEAVKIAKSTKGSDIKDAIFKVDITGVTGSITFDQTTGDANKDMAYIKRAADGAFEFVKTQTVS